MVIPPHTRPLALSDQNALLSTCDLTIKRGARTIVSGINLELYSGELLAIIGPSGAGKSTLLTALSGEDRSTHDQISFLNRPLSAFSPRDLARHRAVLPQSAALNFPFPVLDVVCLGRAPFGHQLTHDDLDLAHHCLELASILHLKDRDYATLSGGERQRVHFARVLAQVNPTLSTPRLLLLDEPTASLDVAHGFSILELAKRLTTTHVAVLTVLHDLNLAARFADRILILHHGRPLAIGPPREVLTPPLLARAFGVNASLLHTDTGHPLISIAGLSDFSDQSPPSPP